MRIRTLQISLVASLLVTLNADAVDLSRFREGEENKRAKLNQLEGKPAPELQLKDWLNGNRLTMADLEGKIVVLDFWATWCGPCIASIPHNNELAAKYKDKGVVFVGVCHPRGMEKMEQTVEKHGMKYPTAKDTEGKTIEAYGANSYPDYYIIDRKGILRVADCQNRMVEEVIGILIAEK